MPELNVSSRRFLVPRSIMRAIVAALCFALSGWVSAWAQVAVPDATRGSPQPVMAAQLWNQLEQSHWVADGDPKAPRIVYVFTDPNCPYCNKLWSDARPWVAAGRVQLRHVIVGILTPTSVGKAAALLSSPDPAKALHDQESGHAKAAARTIQSGDPQPLEKGGVQPLANVPAALQAQIETNNRLMRTAGIQATPGIVWRDASKGVQTHTGAPMSLLRGIFGPL